LIKLLAAQVTPARLFGSIFGMQSTRLSALIRRCTAARFAGTALLGIACMLPGLRSLAQDHAAHKPVFTPEEIRVILSHGPWPAPVAPDPTNRVSGKREAIEFGTQLFFDPRLSVSGTVSCSTCHVPERSWTDNQRRSVGLAELDRNTPTLMNLAGKRWYGWDGAADSLWHQSLRPILDKRELGANPRHVAQWVRNDAEMSCRYRKAFGAPPAADDELVLVNVGKALAAFQETLGSGRTPFDHFRDALSRGAAPASQPYSDAAQRGLKLFIGRAGCTNCHAGPNFSNGEFFATGLSRHAPNGKPDPGRQTGIRELLASRFNLLGLHNDDKTGASATPVRMPSASSEHFGAFKVPSLRNLMLTQPYGRDGRIDTLAEVVRHYAGLDPVRMHAKDGLAARPLNLTTQEQSDLVVFLESLSTFSNPWRPEVEGHCH
jgi:cytochrome c peroxidase